MMPHFLLARRGSFAAKRRLPAAVLLMAALAVSSMQAQVSGGFSLVTSFGASKGSVRVPYAPVIQDNAGNFYGTAQRGSNQNGGIFSLTPNGTLSQFYRFGGGDGAVPVAPLLQDAAGNFYGTTEQGGYHNAGTAFRLSAQGEMTVLHDFGDTDDGAYPEGGLAFGPDGLLYGTTSKGGYYDSGTVFRFDGNGDGYTVGYDFGSTRDDAAVPNAGLYTGTNGFLYGTTAYGGYSDSGTAFEIGTDGTFTILHDFTGDDGANPDASLVQAADGLFYGTTSGGGTYDAGTVFRLAVDGTFASLYQFPDKLDGLQPEASLIQGSDGQLYGTTYYGGTAGGGTVFSLATDGSGFSTLHDFEGGNDDGANPIAAVLQARDGTLYGTTAFGGVKRAGTVYRLALELPSTVPVVTAFVKGSPTAALGIRKAKFIVTRGPYNLAQPLTVTYTLGGTAINGVDYRFLSGSVTIPAGGTRAKVFVAPQAAETTTKTVTLTVNAPTDGSYTLGSTAGGTVQIVP